MAKASEEGLVPKWAVVTLFMMITALLHTFGLRLSLYIIIFIIIIIINNQSNDRSNVSSKTIPSI